MKPVIKLKPGMYLHYFCSGSIYKIENITDNGLPRYHAASAEKLVLRNIRPISYQVNAFEVPLKIIQGELDYGTIEIMPELKGKLLDIGYTSARAKKRGE